MTQILNLERNLNQNVDKYITCATDHMKSGNNMGIKVVKNAIL
jgi:hypothetical protein